MFSLPGEKDFFADSYAVFFRSL